MVALLRVLDPHQVRDLLAVYQRIGDDDNRVGLRFAVAPYLGTGALIQDIAEEGSTQRQRTLARMLQELVGVLTEPQLRSFVEAASNLVGDWWIVETLGEVLLRTEDEGAILRVLTSVREIGPPDLRSRLTNKVVSRLADFGRLETAMATASRVELAAERWAGLADTAERLATKGRFREASVLAEEIVDTEERGRAQAYISLYLARYGRTAAARLKAEQIESSRWRQWIDRCVSDNAGISEADVASEPVAENIQLPPQGDAVEIFVAQARRDPKWAPLVSHLELKLPVDMESLWAKQTFADRHFFEPFGDILRPELMDEMRRFVPVLAKYGTREDLSALDQATKDVGRWWP